MDSEVKVKAKFGGTTRRFGIDSDITWEKLNAKLCDHFDISTDFRVKYCDDEQELVVISSQEELEEALKINKKNPGRLLNLFIEDPSSPQTNDPTLLSLENRNQNANQGKTEGTTSFYAGMASVIAPEFAAMNERLEQAKTKGTTQQATESDIGMSKEQEHQSSKATGSSAKEEMAENRYTNFEEVLALKNQSKNEDQTSVPFESNASDTKGFVKSSDQKPSNKQTPNGSSRGWFGYYEGQRQQKPSKPKSKPKKNKKKGNCYAEAASFIAPRLANIEVKRPPVNQSESLASESDDTSSSDTSMTVQVGSAKFPPVDPGGIENQPPNSNQQQLNQGGQHKEIKRTRRRKKTGRKKGCYAQAALDISPFFGAMNDRLKEKQRQRQQNYEDVISLNDDSEDEDLNLDDSPSPESSYEPFVFVDPTDGQPSVTTSIETDVTEVADKASSLCEDVVPDGGKEGDSSQSTERQMDLEPNKDDMEMNVVGEGESDVNKVVKEVLNSSMDFLVEQTVQRFQERNQSSVPNPVPNEKARATSSTDDEQTTKVLHKGITCDSCEKEIQGFRYKCCNCCDFDLCETCESKPGVHYPEHVFMKLRFEAPGVGRKHGEMVPILKNIVYKKTHERKQKEKQRKAAREAEREERRAMKERKDALKEQEKEKKKEEKKKEKKCMKKQRHEMEKCEQQTHDPRALKMEKVYKKLRMEYVRDVSYPDGSVVTPGQKFLKTWAVQNVGTIAWNQWIKFECIEGDIMATPGKSHVPHLKPDMQGEVSVEFIAPEQPGTYSSKWHLTYGLHTFGPKLWCEIQVAVPVKDKQVQYDQSTLVNSAFVNESPESEPNIPFVEDTKIQAASYLIVDDGSGSEYHSSEETPETEQGRELVVTSEEPLRSLGTQQQLEWDAGCVHDVEVVDVSADDDEAQNMIFAGAEDVTRANNSEDSDNEDDSDSSDEFTVLIPPCFVPDIPLSADPVPVRVGWPRRSGSFNSQFLPRDFEEYLNIDDSEGPSSLPNMSSSDRGSITENLSNKNTVESTKEHSVPVLAPDVVPTANDGQNTPSERISPKKAAVNAPTEKTVLRQHSAPERSVPIFSQPLTISQSSTSPSPTNVVSDVLSSAIDGVSHVARAAFATVDNLINGNVSASAVYRPEDDCEVTVDTVPPSTTRRVPDNNPMSRLIEMGFGDRRLNEQLLRKHNNDIRATIEELLNHTENEWPSQRH